MPNDMEKTIRQTDAPNDCMATSCFHVLGTGDQERYTDHSTTRTGGCPEAMALAKTEGTGCRCGGFSLLLCSSILLLCAIAAVAATVPPLRPGVACASLCSNAGADAAAAARCF